MPIWEYKVITSGSLGFASPQLLEQHLNQLGKEEWEIIHFQTKPDNPLAFSGLARRPVMRDWMVEPAAAPAPAGFKSGAVPGPPEEEVVAGPSARELQAAAEERRETLLAREESLRPLRDDRVDDDEEAEDEEEDTLDEELPTFFDAIRPHMRRNQRGAGMAVGVEYLAKKFAQTESALIEALKECGFAMPASPKDEPVYLEYDGDLYWLNLNSRRQLWINTREKPRAAFRVVTGTKVRAEASPDGGERHPESGGTTAEAETGAPSAARDANAEVHAGEPLPAGPELLDRLRPLMRRNRRDTGLSGSIAYLSRALKAEPATLEAAFAGVGLVVTEGAGAPPVFVTIGAFTYWLNRDRNGQIWINAREPDRAHEPEAGGDGTDRAAAAPTAPQAELALAAPGGADSAAAPASPLAAVRLLLKETTRGGVAAELGNLARQLHRPIEELEEALVGAGLKVPAKPREKPVFAEHAGEVFWLNRNARGELWVNAKPSKYAGEGASAENEGESSAKDGPSRTSRGRRPRRRPEDAPAGPETPAGP